VARLWRPTAGAPSILATGVAGAGLSADGSAAWLDRVRPQGQFQLVVKRLATGIEQPIAVRPLAAGATLREDGARVAFDQVELAEDATYRLRLWDVKSGRELALTPAPGAAPQPTRAEFRREGSLLHAHFENDHEAVYDASTGQQRFSSARSVVYDEGLFSYWGPEDGVLYTPQGGYLDFPADLYAWRVGASQETKLGTRAVKGCFAKARPLFYEDIPGPWLDGPARLVSWSPSSGARWVLSEKADELRCRGTGTVLFREDAKASPPLFELPAGRLVWADLARSRRITLAEDVNSFLVHRGETVFSDASSICALPVWLLDLAP
jgi:hypothetical protein